MVITKQMTSKDKVQVQPSSPRLPGVASEPVALSLVEREVVCAVLDDAVHQLAVLGGIMPDYASSTAAVEHVRTVFIVYQHHQIIGTCGQ